MTRTQEEMNVIAARALLPGLEFSLTQHLETVNEFRSSVGMVTLAVVKVDAAEPRAIQTTQPPKKQRNAAEYTLNAAWGSREPRSEQPIATDQRGHKLTPEGSTAISDGHRAAWAICKKAGLNPKTRPSHEMIERARKILARKKTAA